MNRVRKKIHWGWTDGREEEEEKKREVQGKIVQRMANATPVSLRSGRLPATPGTYPSQVPIRNKMDYGYLVGTLPRVVGRAISVTNTNTLG